LFYIPKKREKEEGVGEGMMIGALERSTKKKSSQEEEEEEEALLWVDKYRPKTLDTLDIHPEWTEKLSR